jgi:hypothetical protein
VTRTFPPAPLMSKLRSLDTLTVVEALYQFPDSEPFTVQPLTSRCCPSAVVTQNLQCVPLRIPVTCTCIWVPDAAAE